MKTVTEARLALDLAINELVEAYLGGVTGKTSSSERATASATLDARIDEFAHAVRHDENERLRILGRKYLAEREDSE